MRILFYSTKFHASLSPSYVHFTQFQSLTYRVYIHRGNLRARRADCHPTGECWRACLPTRANRGPKLRCADPTTLQALIVPTNGRQRRDWWRRTRHRGSSRPPTWDVAWPEIHRRHSHRKWRKRRCPDEIDDPGKQNRLLPTLQMAKNETRTY